MDYRSVNVLNKGYDFRSDVATTYIQDYPQCKEVILRGCYRENWHKGKDLNLNLRVTKTLIEKVRKAWAEYKFPELDIINSGFETDDQIEFNVSLDGLFKSAAWLDVFITFLRVLYKYDNLKDGIEYLEASSYNYDGLSDVMNWVIDNVDKVAEIKNSDITSEDHEYNGLISNKERFIDNG